MIDQLIVQQRPSYQYVASIPITGERNSLICSRARASAYALLLAENACGAFGMSIMIILPKALTFMNDIKVHVLTLFATLKL